MCPMFQSLMSRVGATLGVTQGLRRPSCVSAFFFVLVFSRKPGTLNLYKGSPASLPVSCKQRMGAGMHA